MSTTGIIEGYSPLDTSQPIQSRYARLNDMDNGAPRTYTFSSSPEPSISGSSTLVESDDNTIETQEDDEQDLNPLTRSVFNHSHKYNLHNTLLPMILDMHHIRGIINYEACTQPVYNNGVEMTAKLEEGRVIYNSACALIQAERTACLHALEIKHHPERFHMGRKCMWKRIGENIRYDYRKWRINRQADSSLAEFTLMWKDIVYARQMYRNVVIGIARGVM